MNRRAVAVLLLVGLLMIPAPAAAVVRGEPDISLVASDNRVSPGDTATVGVTVVNAGEIQRGSNTPGSTDERRVTTARGLTMKMKSGGAPITVRTGTVAVGSVPEGAVGPLPFEISVDEDAKPGTYEVPVEVSYTYTERISETLPVHNDVEETETIHVTLVVTDEARFEVVDASTDAPIGGSGRVQVSVRNVGETAASDATLSLQSKNADLTFGGSPTVESFVGEWNSGETRTFSFAGRVASDAERRPLSLAATVAFDDDDGVARQDTLPFGVTPAAEQRFGAVATDVSAPTGGTGLMTVELTNNGDRTLRDATVSFQSSNAALTFGGSPSARTVVGSWEPGETREVTVETTFGPAAEPRAYAVDATVEYTGPGGGTASSAPITLAVRPAAEPPVTLAVSETTAAPGDSGRVTVELTNDGDRALSGATVTFQSSNAALTFGGSPSAKTFVGEWAPGETREVTVEASFAPSAEERTYAVDATVEYTGATGDTQRLDPVTVGVRPAAEQSFSLDATDATLRVGEEGSLSGTLVNDGPETVENAVLVLQPAGSSIDTAETEYALGDIESGESVDFEYEVEVSSEARDGPRQFTYRLQYDDTDGDTRQSDPLYARHEVAPQRQVFTVDTDASVQAGGSTTFEVEVTNNGDGEVSDVTAKLFADSPIGVGDDEAFVDTIPPGESRTLVFTISAAGGATPKDYPVSMDFQYDEPDGDTKLSDTYTVPVRVTERQGGGLLSVAPVVPGYAGAGPVGVGLLATLALGGAALAVRTRR